VHGDIIDEAKTRRGRPAANTQWGNFEGVLAAIWLYSRPSKSRCRNATSAFFDTLIELTQQHGEGTVQMEKLGKAIGLDEYFDLNLPQRRLACFLCACVGAIFGRATEAAGEGVGAVRARTGQAFQDRRRVPRLTASEDVLGKPVASDFARGARRPWQ